MPELDFEFVEFNPKTETYPVTIVNDIAFKTVKGHIETHGMNNPVAMYKIKDGYIYGIEDKSEIKKLPIIKRVYCIINRKYRDKHIIFKPIPLNSTSGVSKIPKAKTKKRGN